MFRHLSPKSPVQNKQTIEQKNKHGGVVQIIPGQHKNTNAKNELNNPNSKDIKNLNNFLNNKQTTNNQKKINIPTPPVAKHTNSSTENLRPNLKTKTGPTFDDYYEKKPKNFQFKCKKGEDSVSADSYQS